MNDLKYVFCNKTLIFKKTMITMFERLTSFMGRSAGMLARSACLWYACDGDDLF